MQRADRERFLWGDLRGSKQRSDQRGDVVGLAVELGELVERGLIRRSQPHHCLERLDGLRGVLEMNPVQLGEATPEDSLQPLVEAALERLFVGSGQLIVGGVCFAQALEVSTRFFSSAGSSASRAARAAMANEGCFNFSRKTASSSSNGARSAPCVPSRMTRSVATRRSSSPVLR